MTLPRLNTLEDLERLLESLPPEGDIDGLGFDMRRPDFERSLTEHPCGSACCIGGWVRICNGRTTLASDLADALLSLAAPHGATYNQCAEICFPGNEFINASPQQAAKALRILRTEGVVDLERAMQPDGEAA